MVEFRKGLEYPRQEIRQNLKDIVVKRRTCREFNPTTKYGKEGSNLLKKDLFEQHAKSKSHETACEKKMGSKNLMIGFNLMLDRSAGEIGAYIDIIKYMIDNNRPNSDFTGLVDLTRNLGCTRLKSNIYNNHYDFEEIVISMRHTIQKNLLNIIQEAEYFSISIDESTDRSISSNLVVYGHFVNKKAFENKPKFLGLISLTEKTGEGIFNALKGFLKTYELNLENIV